MMEVDSQQQEQPAVSYGSPSTQPMTLPSVIYRPGARVRTMYGEGVVHSQRPDGIIRVTLTQGQGASARQFSGYFHPSSIQEASGVLHASTNQLQQPIFLELDDHASGNTEPMTMADGVIQQVPRPMKRQRSFGPAMSH